MGHDESSCEMAAKDEEEGKNRSKELGPWLKAEHSGKKVTMGKAQPRGQKIKTEEQEKLLKEKLTEKLMDRLASLSMTDSMKLDIGKGRSHTPATVTLESPTSKGDIGTADKKGNEDHELSVELATQEPEIFRGRKEGEQKHKEAAKGDETTIQPKLMMGGMEKQHILKDVTNIEPTEKTPIGRKWKRSAREKTAAREKTERGIRQNQKRKSEAGDENEEEREFQPLKMAKTTMNAITAAAAEQPCRAQ
ncbi:hypothetical protein PIB30_034954 [Stylosanthes scabra]|uniref:Uncharacterized protein n=1 Tax=Stylosanthes scabra TaxID=79078 RepID=A0ABU6XEQ4_9FABA|nr:hypothetical protein [Stylosanthes scabra]